MDVPERELVEKSDFEGIPKEFDTLSDGKVLLVKRFDRGASGECIHIEDFVQAFGPIHRANPMAPPVTTLLQP